MYSAWGHLGPVPLSMGPGLMVLTKGQVWRSGSEPGTASAAGTWAGEEQRNVRASGGWPEAETVQSFWG